MAGATVAGVGYERGIREGLRLRAEIVATLSNADLGFSRTISQNHIGVSTLVRRDGVSSGARRARSYVAAGGAVLAQTVCDVDEVGGGGFLGGQTWSCTAFPDIALRWKSPVLAALVAVGVERGRYGLEIRLDQAITSSLASPSGSMRPRHASVIFNYRLRRRS